MDFVNEKTSNAKFVWCIDVLDEEEEEFAPAAGYASTVEEATVDANEYLQYYNYASIRITTLTGKPVVGP